MLKPEELHLTQEWDKTFAKSDRVDHKKVTFINRFGLTLAADQYTPKDAQGRAARRGRLRPLWGSEGAVFRPLRPDAGRAWLPHHRL